MITSKSSAADVDSSNLPSLNRVFCAAPQAAPGRPLIPPVPPPKRHPYDQWSPDARALDLVGDKWTLLIIRDLAAGPRRFVELQRVLPGISTEQLRSRLNRMVADGLLTRQRYREVPPRVDYELTERSRELIPVLGALARWGYDWTWTTPRPGEDVNVGAIFRLAPGVLEPPAGLEGTVELIVEPDADAPERKYLVTLSGGSAEISEVGGPHAHGDRSRNRSGLGARTRSRKARPSRCRSPAAKVWPVRCSTASRVQERVQPQRRPSPRADPAEQLSENSRKRPRRARPCRAMSDPGPH